MRANLGSMERTAFRQYFSDGLIEVLAGLGIIAIGLVFLSDFVAISGLVPIVLVALWKRLHDRLIEPRVGSVTFRPERRASMNRSMQILLLLGTATFVFGILAYLVIAGADDNRGLAEIILRGLPVALLGLGGIVLGWSVEVPRVSAVGALLIVAGVITMGTRLHPGWGLILGGTAVTAIGAALLTRFLRANPVIAE